MNEILKILSIGNAVADPAKWKKRQLLLTVISGSLTILFNVLDYYGIKPPFEVSRRLSTISPSPSFWSGTGF